MDFKRTNKNEIIRFFNRCSSFNWFYSRSEDMDFFRKCAEKERGLQSFSVTNPVLNKIYNDFFKWARKGGDEPDLKNYIGGEHDQD